MTQVHDTVEGLQKDLIGKNTLGEIREGVEHLKMDGSIK